MNWQKANIPQGVLESFLKMQTLQFSKDVREGCNLKQHSLPSPDFQSFVEVAGMTILEFIPVKLQSLHLSWSKETGDECSLLKIASAHGEATTGLCKNYKLGALHPVSMVPRVVNNFYYQALNVLAFL